MDYLILFILYTLIYTQGKSPYASAFAFALLVFGANYILNRYKNKQNVLRLTNLFENALYTGAYNGATCKQYLNENICNRLEKTTMTKKETDQIKSHESVLSEGVISRIKKIGT